MKKKIVFVANRLGGGGAERVLTILANALKNKGYDISILYYNSYDKIYNIECNTSQICSENINSNIKKVVKLRNRLKEENPDFIISFEYFINIRVILASIGLNAKVVISERNDPNKLNNRIIAKKIRDILYNFCDSLVCQTPDAKKYFSERVQKKTTVIPNPIRGDLPKWANENSNLEIINFCRLEKQKNIPLLIDAFKIFSSYFPEYILNIYGEGKERDNIEKYIDDNKLSKYVKIHNFSENIHEIASKARMFVLSSDYEGLSNSMLESMAIGIPVICTDCPIGGAKMVIKDKINGILVPCGDKESMAEAMISIASNIKYSLKLSRNALKIREELSIENIVNIWIRLIDKL